jgi:histone H3/H4
MTQDRLWTYARIYRQRAADCLRLVDSCSEPYAREALRELASEYKQQADEYAAESKRE